MYKKSWLDINSPKQLQLHDQLIFLFPHYFLLFFFFNNPNISFKLFIGHGLYGFSYDLLVLILSCDHLNINWILVLYLICIITIYNHPTSSIFRVSLNHRRSKKALCCIRKSSKILNVPQEHLHVHFDRGYASDGIHAGSNFGIVSLSLSLQHIGRYLTHKFI